MRKLRPLNRNLSGFTLIEILMALLLIAILAVIAITQFTNFSKEAKNAATKANLAIIRNAIQKHFGTMRIRCNLTQGNLDRYPWVDQVNRNDITAAIVDGGDPSPCTDADIEAGADRYFVAGGIPENPWSDKGCTPEQKRTVVYPGANPVGGDTNQEMNVGTNVAGLLNDTPFGGLNCGWIYDNNTGRIKANSNNNNGYPDTESLSESAY